jgi:large subunit ribosomal protein L23
MSEKAQFRHFQTLVSPHVTEKSHNATGNQNQYVFRVAREATKVQVKAAIETVFDVQVEKVQVINVPGKVKRRGKSVGRRPGYRKAVVRLAEGQSLEAMDEA